MEVITGVITLQQIFSKYWEAFKKWHTGKIRKVPILAIRRPAFRRLHSVTVISNVEKILKCRTGQLGFHAYKCPKCGEVKLVPHSCKSRFCSSCGKIATDRWIAETRILNVSDKWVVFKFKDYAVGGRTSVKKMGLFTFIKYLIQHIPDKYFRLVRGYGIFSNCIKRKCLKKALRLLKKRKQRRKKQSIWRDNYKELTGSDPLICERCHIEMEFWFARYGPDEQVLNHFGLKKSDRIPIKQFALKSA